jgi:ferredoxin
MRVWIDQTQCQNSGLCAEDVPELFAIGDDFCAYVKQGDSVLDSPGGSEGIGEVPEDLVNLAESAARSCPAQCIHLAE